MATHGDDAHLARRRFAVRSGRRFASAGFEAIRFVGIGEIGSAQIAGPSDGIFAGMCHLLL